MDISIIIPVYNESQKITHDITAADKFIKTHFSNGEILIIDDGSLDNTSEIALRTSLKKPSVLRVSRYDQHLGKGHAVRTGVLLSKGKYVMFADSGLCIPYKNSLSGLAFIEQDMCDIAHGSRHLPASHIILPHRLSRRISALLFHWIVVFTMNVPAKLTDTQCGFKLYKGNIARDLYRDSRTDGFMFDIEIILKALQRGYRIKEFPVQWRADRDSRLSLREIPISTIKELYRIHLSLTIRSH